jgi:hypothetical protein
MMRKDFTELGEVIERVSLQKTWSDYLDDFLVGGTASREISEIRIRPIFDVGTPLNDLSKFCDLH